MPTYEYQCEKCRKIDERIHHISETPEYKCSECGIIMTKLFSVNITGFIMKGETPAINYREKHLRMKKSEKLSHKQKEKYNEGPKIKPNIAGVETGTWADAQKMAKEAGLNYESYIPYVEKEKRKKF